jgi:hypothetical protein
MKYAISYFCTGSDEGDGLHKASEALIVVYITICIQQTASYPCKL